MSRMKASKMHHISVWCSMGATHISLKKRLRAITSTKVHNTMTVAMEMIFLS